MVVPTRLITVVVFASAASPSVVTFSRLTTRSTVSPMVVQVAERSPSSLKYSTTLTMILKCSAEIII